MYVSGSVKLFVTTAPAPINTHSISYKRKSLNPELLKIQIDHPTNIKITNNNDTMRKFTKQERSTWPYFWAHWMAFQMTAINLRIWKFKYLFHDWYKPWLKMFGVPYKKIQKLHKEHANHHLEHLLLIYNLSICYCSIFH